MNTQTNTTIEYLNKHIAAWAEKGICPGKIFYSLDNIAEYHATVNYDTEVSAYAPRLAMALREVKRKFSDPICDPCDLLQGLSDSEDEYMKSIGIDLSPLDYDIFED
jgi:hypothetical protein